MYAEYSNRRGSKWLGDVTTEQVIGTGISVSSGITTGITAASAATLTPALAAGAVGAAIAGAYALYALLRNVFSGCGPTCVIASQVADRVESILRQNRDDYLAGPRTPETQQAALANFDYAWSKLVAACSDPQLGDAGRRCISERQRGGSAPWCPSGTGCDWFILYRDPIANDPAAQSAAGDSFLPSLGLPADAGLLLPVLGAGLLIAGASL